MKTHKYGWLIQPLPKQYQNASIELEWIAVNRFMNRMVERHPDGGLPNFRYINTEEASWLLGSEAYTYGDKVLLYIWQGVDVINEAQHGRTL